MPLLERIGTLLRANLNDLVERAEDPEKLCKQLVLDMENQLMQVKTQVAMAIADQHLLTKKHKEHSDAVADSLDFRQNVRRHENSAPAIARLGQQIIERFLHEGIETLRGFVQDQQRRVGLKRLDQAELPLHASAVLPQLSAEIAIA